MKRILLQPAYVLHRRAYRETSFLAELLTRDHGRFVVVARGARNIKSGMQGLLQPFIPLLISCSGRTDLLTLSHAELNGTVQSLQGECLFAGFYVNELMMCLTQKWDAQPGLYDIYQQVIQALQVEKLEQKFLRTFEKKLLEELGYGLLPKSTDASSTAFLPDKYYRFVLEKGFVLSDLGTTMADSNIFSGKNLLAMAAEEWRDDSVLYDAKRLTRLMLSSLLGARTLHSKKLFL